MKKLNIFLPLFTLFFLIGLNNLKANDIIDDITLTIKNTDSKALAKYFSQSVEIDILNQHNTFTAAQAQLLLNDFFSKNKSTEVKVFHKVTSNPKQQFAVILYDTLKLKYRISLQIGAQNGKLLINHITIELN